MNSRLTASLEDYKDITDKVIHRHSVLNFGRGARYFPVGSKRLRRRLGGSGKYLGQKVGTSYQ